MGAAGEVSTGLPVGEGARAGAPRQLQSLCLPFRQHTAAHMACPWQSTHTFSPLLSLQQEHVGVQCPSVHIFPDSLQKEQGAVRRTRATTCHARPLKLVAWFLWRRHGILHPDQLQNLKQDRSPPSPPEPSAQGHTCGREASPAQGGWAGAGTSPVVTWPSSTFTPCTLHPHHLRISGLKLWSKDQMKLCRRQHTRSRALPSFSAAPPASHRARGPGRQTLALRSTPSVHAAPPPQGTGA